MKKFFYVGIVALIVLMSESAKALEFEGWSIAGGLATTRLYGDNRATEPLAPYDSTGEIYAGGSFNAVQPGIDLKATLNFKNGLKIPIGIQYDFYNSRERHPISPYMTAYFRYNLNIFSFYSGAFYTLYNFKWANAKIYSGAVLKANYIMNTDLEREYDYDLVPEQNETRKLKTKDNAFRLGAELKLGVEGDLQNRFGIDLNTGFGVINLIGADDNRRELLTPFTDYETVENKVYTFSFNIMLKYKM